MNTLTDVIPQILAQGLMALRETCVMPRLVNSDYSMDAAEQGSTIDVPIPSAIAAQPVAPANTPPATAPVVPTKVQIPLDQWYEAPFYMTDKDLLEAMNGTLPMQASEAIKALANQVNGHILGNYDGVFGFVGTAGTTPFGTGVETKSVTDTRKELNKQLAPMGDRRFVLDPDAEAEALNLRAFQDVNFGAIPGSPELATKMGFNWFMDQLMPTHTAGTGSAYVLSATEPVGETDIPLITGTGTLLVGDIITFAGHTQTYVVTSGIAAPGTITIYPGLKVEVASGVLVTRVDSHVVNLAFHRDAFGFATRPLEDTVAQGLGSIVQSAVDPVSQLTLRLEVSREHKRTRWSYDILWGSQIVRPELAVRLAG